MAKISAHGATKVASIMARLPGSDTPVVFTLCSDGRVLRRLVGLGGNAYYGKLSRTSSVTETTLIGIVTRRGYEVVR